MNEIRYINMCIVEFGRHWMLQTYLPLQMVPPRLLWRMTTASCSVHSVAVPSTILRNISQDCFTKSSTRRSSRTSTSSSPSPSLKTITRQEVETCNPSSRNSSHKLPQIWLSLRPPIFNSQISTDGAWLAVINASFLALSSQGGEEVAALAAPTTNLALMIYGLLQTLIAVSGKTGCILWDSWLGITCTNSWWLGISCHYILIVL